MRVQAGRLEVTAGVPKGACFSLILPDAKVP